MSPWVEVFVEEMETDSSEDEVGRACTEAPDGDVFNLYGSESCETSDVSDIEPTLPVSEDGNKLTLPLGSTPEEMLEVSKSSSPVEKLEDQVN